MAPVRLCHFLLIFVVGTTLVLSSTFLVSCWFCGLLNLLICEVLGFSEECLVDSSLGGFD